MSAATIDAHIGSWTVADVLALPEDRRVRYKWPVIARSPRTLQRPWHCSPAFFVCPGLPAPSAPRTTPPSTTSLRLTLSLCEAVRRRPPSSSAEFRFPGRNLNSLH